MRSADGLKILLKSVAQGTKKLTLSFENLTQGSGYFKIIQIKNRSIWIKYIFLCKKAIDYLVYWY